MSKSRYVPLKYLPARAPVTASILWPLALHYVGAPQWSYGVVGVLLLILWAAWIYWACASEPLKEPPFKD